MTRKKVKLAFIVNDSARKATFKKRKKGLMKKVSELSTLCGIDVCAIIYSPYDPQPEVWPSPIGVRRVLAKFKRMPELEQSKKMVNQESFLRQRILKANELAKKQMKDNREKEITRLMFKLLSEGKIMQDVSMADLNDLAWLIDQNLKEINRRIEVLTKKEEQGSCGQGLDMNVDSMQKQHWFMNLMSSGEDEAHAFGDVNHQSGFWPNSFFH